MPLGPPSSRGALQVATLRLTSAQILALDTVPIQIVAAPGAGAVVSPVVAAVSYTFGTKAYNTAGGAGGAYLGFNYGAVEPFTLDGTVVYDQTTASRYFAKVKDFGVEALAAVANTAVTLDLGDSLAAGPIVTSAKNAGGALYAPGDTGTIDVGGPVGDAAYVIDTVGGGGAVLTYHLTSAGTAYATAVGSTTTNGGGQPGIGTGFTVNITAVTKGDGTFTVSLYYVTFVV